MKLEHFDVEEFASPDAPNSGEFMDNFTVECLDDAREMAGIPFYITSGFRTYEHNAKVGGVEGSAHTKGMAVDIAADEWDRETRNLVILCLGLAGFSRLGEAEEFIHADTDEDKPNPATWGYS